MSSLKILMASFFLISLALPLLTSDGKEYLIRIEIGKRRLILFKLQGRDKKEIGRYPIAVPKNTNWLPLPLIGEVKKIEVNPFWYPTEKTRIAYFKEKKIKLPKIIRPGDPLNAMGRAKIALQFKNFEVPIRIHGTNDPSSIGRRITRGCIRMRNKDILSLITIIKRSRVRVIILNFKFKSLTENQAFLHEISIMLFFSSCLGA